LTVKGGLQARGLSSLFDFASHLPLNSSERDTHINAYRTGYLQPRALFEVDVTTAAIHLSS
jgi:hypothetical protein